LNGLFYDLYANGYCPAGNVSPTGYNDIIEALAQDKLAMTFAGSWSIAEIINTYPDMKDVIGVAPIPTIDGDQSKATASNGGWTYAISSTSQHKEEAAASGVVFLRRPRTDRRIFRSGGLLQSPGQSKRDEYIAITLPKNCRLVGVCPTWPPKAVPKPYIPGHSPGRGHHVESMAIKADPSKDESF
jgi:ABC-type glycerol-3-phosphate transport system substrate-binding protein